MYYMVTERSRHAFWATVFSLEVDDIAVGEIEQVLSKRWASELEQGLAILSA